MAAGFSPDGARIVSGSDDNTVRVWDAASGKELLVLRGHEEPVNAAGFSPDGARIVSGSEDNTVRVWDAASGKELLVLRGHERPRLGRRVLAGWRAHRQRVLWTTRFGCGTRRAARSSWSCAAMISPSAAAGFSPDGARIVSGSWDNTVRVWDAASGKELLVLRGHERPVCAAGFSPDGARIVSGSDDHTVRVWDAASGKELLVLRGHEGRRLGRRVLAGWRAHRQRVRGQHGSGVGRGERQGALGPARP